MKCVLSDGGGQSTSVCLFAIPFLHLLLEMIVFFLKKDSNGSPEISSSSTVHHCVLRKGGSYLIGERDILKHRKPSRLLGRST